MKLFGEKCVRCGKRTRHVYLEKPTCDPCAQQLELVLAASKESKRTCPADGATLGKEIAHGTILDRCPTCRGVWLDAGELERGTLETLLARPLPRRSLYVSTYAAILVALAFVMAALLIGQSISVTLLGLSDEVDLVKMPLVWLNGMLLWGAFASFGVAASLTFDRSSRAVGLTAAFVLISYFLEIIGSLWTDAAFLQKYSLFHYFVPGDILTGEYNPAGIALLVAALIIPIGWSLFVFPRRQLPAPA